ncbi:AMP-binding protein [Tsukamurella strandjordii]|uniref:AMP-binding protein n=1 Tax=Tsukamurella strandjordii TaxID=147577 RepID=UPI0031D09433
MAADLAFLAPPEPHALLRAHRAARAADLPLILGSPAQQRATFGAPSSADIPTVRLMQPIPDVLVLAATSGTSGRTTFVPWTESVLDYQARATVERMGTGPDTRYGLAVSPASAYGFSVVNLTARCGGTLEFFAATDHAAITRALLDRRIDTLDTIPGVWRYLATAAETEPMLARALRRLTVRGVGGEVVPHSLLDRYERLDAPLHNGYGLTEAGPNVSISCGDGYGRRTAGLPLTGTAVRIGHDGAVQVRGPGVTGSVYLPDRGLRANPAVAADGWLDTGDIGTVDAAGRLTLLGRADGLFAGHGRKLHASVIEDTVRDAVPADTEVIALQLDPLGSGAPRVVIALVDPDDAVPGGVVDLTARQRALPIEFRVRDVVRVPRSATVRTGSGKLDRNHLAALASGIIRAREEQPCARVS